MFANICVLGHRVHLCATRGCVVDGVDVMKSKILVATVVIVLVIVLVSAPAVVMSDPVTPTPNYYYLPLVESDAVPTPAPPGRETPTPAFPGGEL